MKESETNEMPVSSALAEFVRRIPWGEEDRPRTPVRVEFSGDRTLHATVQIDRINDRKSAKRHLASIIPKEAVDELVAFENRLFTWLDKDKSNPTRFLLDPLGSLEKAGLKLSERAATALRLHREAQKRTYDVSATKGLTKLEIKVADSTLKPPQP
jgi:hypothetical protein